MEIPLAPSAFDQVVGALGADALYVGFPDDGDQRTLATAPRLEDARAALDRIDALPLGVDELAQTPAAASRRQSVTIRTDRAPDGSIPTNEAGIRALPFGSGWLEWRRVAKPPAGSLVSMSITVGAKAVENAQRLSARFASVCPALPRTRPGLSGRAASTLLNRIYEPTDVLQSLHHRSRNVSDAGENAHLTHADSTRSFTPPGQLGGVTN